MKNNYIRALSYALLAVPTAASAELTLFGKEGFHGKPLSVQRNFSDIGGQGMHGNAYSAIVYKDRWEVCEHARFEGRCVVLRPGRYPTIESMGLRDGVTSVRMIARTVRVEESTSAPPAYPVYDARPRHEERLFQADVVNVRAIYGRPEQRCWVEREQVADQGNVAGGAVVGAIIGGVLGHQVGSGRGNDVATAAGAVGGAALGANIARDANGAPVYNRDVRKCSSVPGSAKVEYWDVTYVFKGVEHHMQTSSPPARTVTVNGRGEPRA